MRGKKLLQGISIIMALFLFTGCNYEDTIPDNYELGLWEGNYIYQGNLRTKTTGENTETLVSEISYESKTYEIGDTVDYRFVNNDILLIVEAIGPSKSANGSADEEYLLLKYSPQNKETEVYYEGDLLDFYYVSSDYCIFNSYYTVLKIDFSTQEVINIPTSGKHYLIEDYLVMISNGYIQYTSLNEIEFKTIAEEEDYDYGFGIVEKDSHKYLRMTKSMKYFLYAFELAFIDLETDSMHIVWPSTNNKKLSLIGDDYFVVGETKGFDYYSEYTDSDTGERKVFTGYLVVDNELYKINYSDINISSEKIYTFDYPNMDYTSGQVENSNLIIFFARWVEMGSPTVPGDIIKRTYMLDLERMILSEYRRPSGYAGDVGAYNHQQSIEYGNFKYYFETESYGDCCWLSFTAYFLYRQNLTTNKVELMQSFSDESDDIGLRFAEDFWHFDDSYSINFDDSHFLILNY